MRNKDLGTPFNKFCPNCKTYEQETGVCKKFYFNVRDYPSKFVKMCSGKHGEYYPNTVVYKEYSGAKDDKPDYLARGIFVGIVIGIIVCVFLFPGKFLREWNQSGIPSLFLIAGVLFLVAGVYFSRGGVVVINLVIGAYLVGVALIVLGLYHAFDFIVNTYIWIGIVGGGIVGAIGGGMIGDRLRTLKE